VSCCRARSVAALVAHSGSRCWSACRQRQRRHGCRPVRSLHQRESDLIGTKLRRIFGDWRLGAQVRNNQLARVHLVQVRVARHEREGLSRVEAGHLLPAGRPRGTGGAAHPPQASRRCAPSGTSGRPAATASRPSTRGGSCPICCRAGRIASSTSARSTCSAVNVVHHKKKRVMEPGDAAGADAAPGADVGRDTRRAVGSSAARVARPSASSAWPTCRQGCLCAGCGMWRRRGWPPCRQTDCGRAAPRASCSSACATVAASRPPPSTAWPPSTR